MPFYDLQWRRIVGAVGLIPSKVSGSLRLSEERVVDQFLQRFTELDFNKPQFIYLFQAAYFPYSHPNMQKILIDDFIPRSEIRSENRKRVAETYWNAIANADWAGRCGRRSKKT